MSLRALVSRALRPMMSAGAYESTSTAPKVDDWQTTTYGPNAALDDSRIARARSQDAARNNPWIRRALSLLVSHQIGCGIQPLPKIADPNLRNQVLDLWVDWVAESDADGALDFYGQQSLLARARYESGEAFVRLRVRRPEDGLTVPLQLQILESDLLPTGLNRLDNAANIRQGIERNSFGQRIAYWFHREHPGDRYFAPATLTSLSRVPASEVLHHYQPLRPGQLRGEPTPISALYRARNLDQFESAELARKKIKARFAGVIWKENVDENPLAPDAENATLTYLTAQLAAAELANDTALAASLRDQITAEREKKSIVDVEDGYMLQLALNERVELSGGDTGNSGIDFMRTQLRSIAAGMNVPYELMTGDYEGTNDRIMRVILNAFYRDLETTQDLLVNQILQPLWQRWIMLAVYSGSLTIPGFSRNPRAFSRCEWRAHGWSYVNPLQEAQTAILRINNGLTSRRAAVAETGWDVEEIDRQQADDHAREESLGLEYGVAPAAESTATDKPTP